VVKSISENALTNNPNKSKSHNLPITAIILVGFMGAGKTSVGRALAERLGWIFEDLDEQVERRARRSVAEIFRDSGESEFRRAEREALQELLAEVISGSRRVIALGGGAFAQEASASLIEAAGVPTVFLDAGIEELWSRCTQQATSQGIERPMLSNSSQFRSLYEERRPHYSRASLRQETGGKPIDEIVAELIRALDLSGEGAVREGSQGDS
jgi:shikimate kinase